MLVESWPPHAQILIWVDLETSVIHPRFMLLVPKAVDRLLSIQLLQWVIATVDFGEVGLSHVPSALSSVQRATTFIRVYIASLNKFSQKIKISKFFSRPPAA